MKKFLQISLIVVLGFMLFQTTVGEAPMGSGLVHPVAPSQNSLGSNTSLEGVQMAACLVSVKGVICVIPNVGWNS